MSRSFESQGSLIGGDVREDEDPLKGISGDSTPASMGLEA